MLPLEQRAVGCRGSELMALLLPISVLKVESLKSQGGGSFSRWRTGARRNRASKDPQQVGRPGLSFGTEWTDSSSN